MGTDHTPADDIVYDLVSIQYHALQAAQTYDKYLEDAQGHEDVRDFIRSCAEHDAERAKRCHTLLAQLTKDGIGS
jgi:predicted metal-dependent hydrolase